MDEKNFIKRCFKNLEKKNIFYKYYDEKKNYLELKVFFQKFKKIISSKRIKIVTFSDKSFEMYASIISIFLSNNIWVPLSLSLPIDRLIKILQASKVKIIISEKNLKIFQNVKLKRFIKKNRIMILTYDEINHCNSEVYQNLSIPKFNYNEISMIYFTSGSTGNPKGVPITYRNFISCFFSKKRILYKNSKKLIFGDYHDPSFVISLVILFPCFYLGSTISPSKNMFETLNPSNHIYSNNVNTLITVPSTINRIKDDIKSSNLLRNMSKIIMCGEPFRLDLAKFILDKLKPKELYNFYGSTEVSPWIFYHRCSRKDLMIYKKFDLVPVGVPLKNVKVKIDKNELIVSGPVVTDGYLDSKQNLDTFFNHDGKVWYKTKDQVEIFKNKYFIKGRIDKVVKIHGYRVDLGDIEINIRKIKNIDEVIVFIKKIKNKKVLSCAIKSNLKFDKEFLLKNLSKSLPNYMIPKNISFYKKFPLNRSGKIDRKKITS